MPQEIKLDYDPQERQLLLHTTPANQILYGGAAGGGKSHAIRWDAIRFCLENPGCEAYLFRRSLPELEDNHIRKIQTELGIPNQLGSYVHTRKRVEFFNKSAINFCYCESEDDVRRYQGAEIYWLGLDEATHLTEFQISFLRTRVRLGNWKPADKYKGSLPRIVYATNPGGPSHSFLKRMFIDIPAPPETLFWDASMADADDPTDKGWLSIFIPAKIADNKYLEKNYKGQFRGLPPEMARALSEGDWDAVVGQALHTLSKDKHRVAGFYPPKHWTKFMAIDWGAAKPFSVGWFAVSDGTILKNGRKNEDVILPPESVILYREWYGWNGRENKGCRMDAREVARKIIATEEAAGDVMDYRIGDDEMWAARGQLSIQEHMRQATNGKLIMKQSHKDRKQGYNEFLCRLAGSETWTKDEEWGDSPMFFITDECTHFWRTVPNLLIDENDADKGPETKKQEDHVYDMCVYAFRSRPYALTPADRERVVYEEDIRSWKKQRRNKVGPYTTR